MANLLVDDRDQKFILFEQLNISKLSEYPLYADFDTDTYNIILDEARRIAVNETFPTNMECDSEGVTFKDGKVSVPMPFHKLWALWNEGGWRGLDIAREFGGQGMPVVIGMAANEYFEAGNLAFQTLAAMTRGAAQLIAIFGTEEQRKKYVDKIMSGKWTGTMDLTEANAGSDTGALMTAAERRPDGTFSIRGSKVFITGGNTDLTENIIHLVLARIKGSPEGTKGLSLFLVPAYKINPDGTLGKSNDVRTVSVEKKLGIKGSPTCQLSFGDEEDCIGELVGKENRGMEIFFTMMNESRLIAARHGASVASSAYLHALNFAKERLQGKEIGKNAPGQSPIIKHPDVRRMLLMMKAYTEGARVLLLYASYCIDREHTAKNAVEKAEWETRLGFLTPVTKAYVSDMSFRVTETALQIYGGYGYTKDYPVEQFLRDEKVHSIFEGTNGIQALTLAARELCKKSELLLNGHLKEIREFCTKNIKHPKLGNYVSMLNAGNNSLTEISEFLVKIEKKDFRILALYATQYLELFGDITTGWLLLWQAVIAQDKLENLININKIKPEDIARFISDSSNAAFYYGKLASVKYFLNSIVSLAPAKAGIIKSADKTAIDIPENAF